MSFVTLCEIYPRISRMNVEVLCITLPRLFHVLRFRFGRWNVLFLPWISIPAKTDIRIAVSWRHWRAEAQRDSSIVGMRNGFCLRVFRMLFSFATISCPSLPLRTMKCLCLLSWNSVQAMTLHRIAVSWRHWRVKAQRSSSIVGGGMSFLVLRFLPHWTGCVYLTDIPEVGVLDENTVTTAKI